MRAVDEVHGWRRAGRYALLAVVAVVVLLPIYVTVMGAFKPGNEIVDYPRALLPVDFTLQTFREAWNTGHMGRYLFNSTVVSILITVGEVSTSVFAGYAFAFLTFPFKRLVFVLFLATLMVPGEVTVLVNVETIQNLHWIDSYQALVVPFLATAFGTFLMRQVFLTVPTELREAAALDGLGHWAFMKDVAVPLARPTIGALTLFAFLGAWNQYLWPQRVTNSDQYRTVQIGLKALQSSNIDKLNLIMAGTVIAAIPIFVVLVIFQRQLIRGLTAGALKG
jgi:sn-glycerol 3-phosphate transport system permease protein